MGLFAIKGSICLAALFGVFWLFLRRSTFYQLNRVVLLMIALMPLLFPFVEVPENWREVSDKFTVSLS